MFLLGMLQNLYQDWSLLLKILSTSEGDLCVGSPTKLMTRYCSWGDTRFTCLCQIFKTKKYCSLKFYFFWVVCIHSFEKGRIQCFQNCFSMSDTKPVLWTLLCCRQQGNFLNKKSHRVLTDVKICFEILFVYMHFSFIHLSGDWWKVVPPDISRKASFWSTHP